MVSPLLRSLDPTRAYLESSGIVMELDLLKDPRTNPALASRVPAILSLVVLPDTQDIFI